MKVIRAKSAGFCMGVSLAVRKLDKAIAEKDPTSGLYTLGPIIHNPALVTEYEGKGAICLEDYSQAAPGSTVVLRAHGLPCQLEKAMQERGLRIIDATCPRVKSAQLAIKKNQERGGSLLLFGEKDHPEIQGLLSYANPDALVFSNLEELMQLRPDPARRYFVAAQTTQDKEVFAQAVEWLQGKLQHNLQVLNTICNATSKRQDEVIELTGLVKSMVIVGGMNSGNTRRLAEIAASRGIFTVHCECPKNLPLDKLKKLQPIGLSAGASTPDSQINAIEIILRGVE